MTNLVDGGSGHPLEAALSALAGALDQLAGIELWQLAETQLRQAAAGLDRAGLLAQAQLVRLLGEVDARALPGRDGTASLGGWLRSVVPAMGPGQAAGLGKRAERLYRSALAADLAPTRDGVLAGTVRPEQERLISATIEALTPPAVPAGTIPEQQTADAQQVLVAEAAGFPVTDLAQLATAIRHHLDPAADDRLAREEAAQHRARTLTLTTEASGMVYLQGSLTPQCGAALRTAIDTWSAPTPTTDGAPDPRTPAQRRHDGLQQLAETALARGQVPTSHGSPAKLIVRVDLPTLTAALHPNRPPGSQPTALAPAELADGHPISQTALARIACHADLVPVLLDDLGQPLDVGRTHRLFTPRQRTALTERDRGCTWPGCTAPPEWTQAHHLTPWTAGGPTDLTNAALLCGRHHRHAHTTGATGHITNGHVQWDHTGTSPPDPASQPGPPLIHHLTRRWLTRRRQ
jgi:hypothetical protein